MDVHLYIVAQNPRLSTALKATPEPVEGPRAAPWRRARLLPDAEAGEDVAQEIVRCLLAGDLLDRVRGFL